MQDDRPHNPRPNKGKRQRARPEDIAAVQKLPTLKSYLDRIDAEITSFRKAVKQERDESGYWRDICDIEWSEGGTVECSAKEYEPTEGEEKAIATELATATFPKSIAAGNAKALLAELKLSRNDPSIFEFRSREGDAILFVQQRVDRSDGEKIYLPWTFFDDGVWRRLEPDGKLPLYGLEQLKEAGKNVARLWLHEGAKAARFCRWLNGDTVEAKRAREKHPWAKELCGPGVAHLGWPGGATNPHRADFSDVKRLPPSVHVTLVCDNDDVGKNAARPISRFLSRTLQQVLFDGRFKFGFDLADDLHDPENKGLLFEEQTDGELFYVGPLLADLTFPATWATRPVIGSSGKVNHVARPEFLAEWIWVNEVAVLVNKSNVHRRYSKDSFNDAIAPFSDVENVARLVIKENSTHRDVIIYRPGSGKETTTTVKGIMKRAINVWTGPNVPLIPDIDVGPLIEFFEYLCPRELERETLMNFCATLIAAPGEKMHFGVLLVGPQGIGKNTIGEVIELGLGAHNVSWVEQNALVESEFNAHLAMKQLVVCPEIYAGNSSKAYDRLKSVITDATIQINEKFQRKYEIENWAHVIACSNSERALKLENNDRRWFIPSVTDKKWSPEKFAQFHSWKEKYGAAAIITWARNRVANGHNIIRKGQQPPETEAKREMVRETWSPGMHLVRDTLAQLQMKMNGKPVLIGDKTFVKLIQHHIYDGRHSDRLEKPSTIRKVAKAEGWFISEQRVRVHEWTEVINATLICSSAELAGKSPGELRDEGLKPMTFDELKSEVVL